MKFTLAAYTPSILFWFLYAMTPDTPKGVEQAGALGFAAIVLWYLATPFVFIYWAARVVKRVWRGASPAPEP